MHSIYSLDLSVLDMIKTNIAVILFAAVSFYCSGAFAMSCSETDVGGVSLKFRSGNSVEMCIWTDCFNAKYRGDPAKRATFKFENLDSEFWHVRKNRYRLKWIPNEAFRAYGQKILVLNMICR